ncbi:MAG TPA: Crp/Fnr family transcriptional regulator [Microvirga sp.]|jgi:CRP-like cAMP-binding protein|nr:Crp/Fnr family transcriptional regulator [Microvirga sp.]
MDAAREHPLIRRLESITDLSPEERSALVHLPMNVREIAADQDIVREGDKPSECCLILKGYACRYKTTDDGKRQIMSFHLQGEIPDFQSLYLRTMDHSLGTLTPCRMGFVAHQTLHGLFERHPRLMAVFTREALIDAAIFREWMLNIGRRRAEGRLAHLLCELFLRHKAVGLARDHAIAFPITQAELADAVGFSTVHVNRVLQELRGMNLLSLEDRVLTILDWPGLKRVAQFDPTYLHQESGDEGV